MGAEGARVAFDLRGELACGGQHKGARPAWSGVGARCTEKAGQRGQQKRSSFACAGLCAAGNIAASDRGGEHLSLDGGAIPETEVRDSVKQLRG